jgi:hypothetical protein
VGDCARSCYAVEVVIELSAIAPMEFSPMAPSGTIVAAAAVTIVKAPSGAAMAAAVVTSVEAPRGLLWQLL